MLYTNQTVRFIAVMMTLVLASPAGSEATTDPPRPNVVIIFIDDMGYGDVGFNGADQVQTPNLDRMAAEGMRMTDFYVGCAVCSGSRAALMTGRHYRRLGIPHVLFPDSDRGLSPDEVTLADMLSGAGYDTACIGKWHLGHLSPCLPTDQGFDSYWGIPYSNDMWIDPANRLADDVNLRGDLTRNEVVAGHKARNAVPIFRDDEVIEYPADQTTLTKRYTERAIEFISTQRDQPFFLYLPHSMVHRPLHVSAAFNDSTKPLILNAIEEVDWSVGQILQTLRRTGQAERTLVLFTSDNGAAVGSSYPLRSKKGSVYDGGIREPTAVWWPGHIPPGTQCDAVTASVDLMPTLVNLCGGELPPRKLDGHDIWPLLSGSTDQSPHDAYVLMHGPGTVRSGRWKFYPWAENHGKAHRADRVADPSPLPVQLYDIVADIGETTNVADRHPDVVRRLQTAYDTHVADVQSSARTATEMIRPDDALSAARPKPKSRSASKSRNPSKSRDAPNRSTSAFETIFDGTTFDGWKHSGNWVLQKDGSMFRKSRGGDIVWTRQTLPDDFELRFQWKVGSKSNSGVYYRPGQYEYQILANDAHRDGTNPRTSAASLYFCVPPSHDATLPPGQWNSGRIVCKGTFIEHWLNDQKVVAFDYTDPRFADHVELLRRRGGKLADRGGQLRLQDHGDPVWFRDIRLRNIPRDEPINRETVTPASVPATTRKAELEKVEAIEARRAAAR